MNAPLTLALAILALSGTSAPACDEVVASGGHGVATVVMSGSASGDEDGVVHWSDNHSIEVRHDNGEISVVIDGKPVPAARIRREDGRVVILDEEGNEHPLFGMMMGEGPDAHAFAFKMGGEAGAEPFAFAWDGVKYEPKVMLGIHLDRPGAALEKHLGLEAGATTMISGLYKGLPADNAGLELYDIVTAIDGKAPADPGAIIEALSQRAAGDVVALTVIQAGKTRRVQVTVEAYDRQRMADAEMEGSAPQFAWAGRLLQPGGDFRELLVDPQNQQWFRRSFDAGQIRDQVREHMRHFEDFAQKKAENGLDGRLDNLNSRLEELRKMLDELVEKAAELGSESEVEER